MLKLATIYYWYDTMQDLIDNTINEINDKTNRVAITVLYLVMIVKRAVVSYNIGHNSANKRLIIDWNPK